MAKHHELDVTVQVSGGSNDQSDKAANHKYANAKCSDGTSRKTEARWYEGPLVEATISGSVLQPDAARSSGGRSPRHVFEAIPPLAQLRAPEVAGGRIVRSDFRSGARARRAHAGVLVKQRPFGSRRPGRVRGRPHPHALGRIDDRR